MEVLSGVFSGFGDTLSPDAVVVVAAAVAASAAVTDILGVWACFRQRARSAVVVGWVSGWAGRVMGMP